MLAAVANERVYIDRGVFSVGAVIIDDACLPGRDINYSLAKQGRDIGHPQND